MTPPFFQTMTEKAAGWFERVRERERERENSAFGELPSFVVPAWFDLVGSDLVSDPVRYDTFWSVLI